MMKIIYGPIFSEHNTQNCLENFSRLDLLVEDLIPDARQSGSLINPIFGEEYLSLVHDKSYISSIKDICSSLDSSNEISETLNDLETCVSNKSYNTACYAVGSTILAARYAREKAENAFALVRPPGHHANISRSHGFCLFNNIAIASTYMAKKEESVLIIDIDLHHGDGTQEIITRSEYEDKLFYLSIHQEDTFPFTGDQSDSNIINIPVRKNISEKRYINKLKKGISSAFKAFSPTLIAISAGFDNYYLDKENSKIGNTLSITKKTYQALLNLIAPIPFFAVLEGGYDPRSVYDGVLAFYEWDKK